MSQALNGRFAYEPVRTLAAASVAANYTAIGGPLLNPARQFFIQNLTDQTVMISFDGISDAFPLPASGNIIEDIAANYTHQTNWSMAQGTTVYVKRIGTPTTGSVYVSIFYAAGINV